MPLLLKVMRQTTVTTSYVKPSKKMTLQRVVQMLKWMKSLFLTVPNQILQTFKKFLAQTSKSLLVTLFTQFTSIQTSWLVAVVTTTKKLVNGRTWFTYQLLRKMTLNPRYLRSQLTWYTFATLTTLQGQL